KPVRTSAAFVCRARHVGRGDENLRDAREGRPMSDQEVGFVTMGQAEAAEEIPTIGIGMLGYAFMGKAHSNALKKIAYMTWPPPYMPRLVAISGRTEDAVREAARRYGYDKWTTSW